MSIDWTTITRSTTAADLAARLGVLDVDALGGWARAVGVAGRDLAAAADRPWPFGDDAPLVALLRAVGRLAADAPDATSTTAGALLDALDAAFRDGSLGP